MEPDKNTPDAADKQAPQQEQDAPVDALSRTPDDLEQEKVAKATTNPTDTESDQTDEKKVSPIKKFFRRVNVYFLFFVLIMIIAGATTIVNYLNSQKAPPEPSIATQKLTQDALKQLANSDASVGSTSQTLTIQGNTVIAGQTLMRGNLNIAGNMQTGGSINGPSLTISGASNLGATQINSLQVATSTAIQGTTTLRDLNVAGVASFSGAVSASQLTVNKLIVSGNGILQVPNHLSFVGPSPNRSFIGSSILGASGTVSVNGSDTSGTININSGNNPSGSGCIVRITFQQAFATQPHVIVSPVGNAAGKLEYYVDRTNTGFNLCTNNTPEANKVFAFDYFVAG